MMKIKRLEEVSNEKYKSRERERKRKEKKRTAKKNLHIVAE